MGSPKHQACLHHQRTRIPRRESFRRVLRRFLQHGGEDGTMGSRARLAACASRTWATRSSCIRPQTTTTCTGLTTHSGSASTTALEGVDTTGTMAASSGVTTSGNCWRWIVSMVTGTALASFTATLEISVERTSCAPRGPFYRLLPASECTEDAL